MNTNPIERWSPARFWTVFFILTVLAVAVVIGMKRNDRALQQSCTRSSAALEYIASPIKASNIVQDWENTKAIDVVDRGVFLDFLFILFYATWLALSVFRCSNALELVDWWHTVGDQLGWWMWIAGAFDVIENLGILAELHLHAYGLAPVTASAMALKYMLIAVGVLYIAFTGVLYLRTRAAGDHRDLRAEIRALQLEDEEKKIAQLH